MHNSQNEISQFSGETSWDPYLVFGAARLCFRSSPTDMYVTIGLRISVLENYTWPITRTDLEGSADAP